jgi:hypothetical protein
VRIVTSPEEREQMQLAKDPPPIPSPHRAAPSHSTQRRS